MRLTAIALLAGCNQVYGLDPTRLTAGCPALGEPLVVGTKLHQISTEPCLQYATSADANLSIAQCVIPPGGVARFELRMGEIGGALEPVTFPPSPAFPAGEANAARLSADGSEVWLAIDDGASNLSTQSVYRKSGDAWTWQYDVPFIATRQTIVSAPTRGLQRHILVDDIYDSGDLVELVESAEASWTEVRRISSASLGLEYIESPTWSADGLRLLVYGDADDDTIGWFYTDRAQIDDAFGAAHFIPRIPQDSGSMQLSEDCTRVYFPALDSVFYLGQSD